MYLILAAPIIAYAALDWAVRTMFDRTSDLKIPAAIVLWVFAHFLVLVIRHNL